MLGLPIPSLDTLLSLPLLSLLVLPSAISNFSWTTSLNLLFFYMAWSSIVLSHQPLHIELFGALATRVVFYLAPCLLFFAFDLSVPSVATSIKAHGQRALPRNAVRRGTSSQRLLRYVGVCIGNVLLGVLLQSMIEYAFTHLFSMRSALRISTTLPMPLALAKDLSKAYLVRGPLTFYIHRHLLHSPETSPTLTKWHANWQHSLTTTLPFSSSYDHPLVYLIHRWLPVYLPAFLFRIHMLTFLLFLALVSLEEAFAWSGYNVLPSTIMLAGMARRTEAHLMKEGKGNYGPFGLMDWIHGSTLAGSDVMDDIGEEARKHDAKGKAKTAASSVGNAASDVIELDDEDGSESGTERNGDTSGPQSTISSATEQVSRALRNRGGK